MKNVSNNKSVVLIFLFSVIQWFHLQLVYEIMQSSVSNKGFYSYKIGHLIDSVFFKCLGHLDNRILSINLHRGMSPHTQLQNLLS